MWLSNKLSSSPDDVPMVNTGPFFRGGTREAADFLRMGVGCAARLVCERYDEGAPPGTKPRTMLCVLISVVEVSSEPNDWDGEVLLSLVVAVPIVDVADDSRAFELIIESVVAIVSARCSESDSSFIDADVGMAKSIGCTSGVSRIDWTKFWRSVDVMCFSRPRL